MSTSLPADVHTLMFFNEIDEGLWFYTHRYELAPVPGSHPQYNTAYDLAAQLSHRTAPVRDNF